MTERFQYKLPLGMGADGKVHRKSFYSTKSRADAKRKAMKWKETHAVEEFLLESTAVTNPRFSDWAKRCLDIYKKDSVKGNTFARTYYDPLYNHLIPYFGTTPLEDIGQMDIQKYVTEACKTLAVSTVQKDVVVLDLVFRMAVKNGMCAKNPVDEIKFPREKNVKAKRAFTQEQYDAAYELAKKWGNGEAIMLMLETGVSRSELLGLRWEDLDDEKHYIHINQGVVVYKDIDAGCNKIDIDGLKNKYRRRSVPIIDDGLWQRLQSIERTVTYQGNEIQTEYVFHTLKGTPWDPNTWASRVFRPFMQALCAAHPDFPKLSPHEIRHTRATLWIAQGIDPYMVARLLGHCDTKMISKVYDHTRPETLEEALKKATGKNDTNSSSDPDTQG